MQPINSSFNLKYYSKFRTSTTNLRTANLCPTLYQKGRGRHRNRVFHHFCKTVFHLQCMNCADKVFLFRREMALVGVGKGKFIAVSRHLGIKRGVLFVSEGFTIIHTI